MSYLTQTAIFNTKSTRLAQIIRDSITPTEQLMPIRSNAVLVVLREQLAYIHLLRPQAEPNSTKLQLVIEDANKTRAAFEGKLPQEALKLLAREPSEQADPRLEQAVAEWLEGLQKKTARFAEVPQTPGTVSSAPTVSQAPEPISTRNPWNPSLLSTLTLAISTIGSGLLLSWNWRRLGRPEWTRPSMLVIPAQIMCIVIALVGLVLLRVSLLTFMLWGFAGGFNIGSIIVLSEAQRGLYKHWEKTATWEALRAYQVKFKIPLIYGFIMVLAAVITACVVWARSDFAQSAHLDTADFTLTYGYPWSAGPLAQDTDSLLVPLVYLSHLPACETAAGLGKLIFPQSITLEELQTSLTGGENAPLHSADVSRATLGGVPALRFFYCNDHPPITVNRCGIQLYAVKGAAVYMFTADSTSRARFDEQRADIDALLSNLIIK